MTELVKEGHFYTEESKQLFVEDYFRTGKLSVSCANTGVSYETSKYWARQEWFDKALAKVKAESDRQMERRLTAIADKALDAMQDRIDNGEERISKTGKVVVLKPGLAALTIAMGTIIDKRTIIRSGGVSATPDNILEQLAIRLRDFAKKRDAIDVPFTEVPQG